MMINKKSNNHAFRHIWHSACLAITISFAPAVQAEGAMDSQASQYAKVLKSAYRDAQKWDIQSDNEQIKRQKVFLNQIAGSLRSVAQDCIAPTEFSLPFSDTATEGAGNVSGICQVQGNQITIRSVRTYFAYTGGSHIEEQSYGDIIGSAKLARQASRLTR